MCYDGVIKCTKLLRYFLNLSFDFLNFIHYKKTHFLSVKFCNQFRELMNDKMLELSLHVLQYKNVPFRQNLLIL